MTALAPEPALATGTASGPVTPGLLRTAARRFGTGVTVITVPATQAEPVHGMTANAFMTVSLQPPLVGVGIRADGQTSRAVRDTGSFGISVLGAAQHDLAMHFADPGRPSGPAQFTGVDWWPGAATGTPLLAGALAWFECSVVGAVDAGDHHIFLGHVLAAQCGSDTEPLVFYEGRYQRLAA